MKSKIWFKAKFASICGGFEFIALYGNSNTKDKSNIV